MKSHHNTTTANSTRFAGHSECSRSKDRGAALVITLILLMLLSAGAVAIVLLTSSDTMINGYYRNYRGSFYAADSGANVVTEAIRNAVTISANDAANPPLPIVSGVPVALQSSAAITAAYSPYLANYYKVGDTGSWNGQFKVLTLTWGTPSVTEAGAATDGNACGPVPPALPGSALPANCPATCTTPGTSSCHVNDDNITWTYSYPFTIQIQGESSGTENEIVTEEGAITYTSTSGTTGTGGPPSFSKWGGYITNFAACQGPLVPGTMTGPFFTDGQWNFGNYTNPNYTFTDSVGQEGSQVSWWTSGSNCSNSGSAPKGFNQPNFEGGFQTGQPAVTPPTDSYSQADAVLNGAGYSCTAGSCTDSNPPQTGAGSMNSVLKTVSGTAYPTSGTPSSGVYIPYSGSTYGTAPTSGTTPGAAGGFYIAGNASITLTAGTDSGGNPTQTYTISQGSGHSATTTTITVDPFVTPSGAPSGVTGTTTVSAGGSPLVLAGVPSQVDPDTGAAIVEDDPSGNPMYPTMIYVNGEVTGLSGTVANQAAVTISTGSVTGSSLDTDINITGDITYTSLPVSTSSDTLNSTTNAGVLGLYTNGNIDLNPNSSGSNKGNLTVDAALAAIGGANGTAGFETPGSSIGTWTILGGRSEDQAHSVSISQGNTIYDRRFGTGSFGPPWFPTAVPTTGASTVPPSSPGANVQRTYWQETRP
ncbi:MAG TPA: PilX N-terminal domain-containing pilus assembly protein [Candidatus Acidoferrum sp.]|nr:PilX N-terminal domain-containing pilus assembly protein [Candidatus Acidoferrum sp.]